MKKSKSAWNGDDWFDRCAWCTRRILEHQEVLALKARLRVEAKELLEPGTIQPLSVPGANITVPMILPALNSPARKEGAEAVFQVCSKACARQLQKTLREELGMVTKDFPRPQPTAPLAPEEELDPDLTSSPVDFPFSSPGAAMASMEKMMRQLHRLLAKKKFQSPEEVDAYMQSLAGLPPDSEALAAPPESPLEKAQDLIDQAQTEPASKRRVKLAKRALKISPDCADAYLLLAQETADDPARKRELYEQAVQAAEHALGPEIFREAAGAFWGIIETRPYMRARAALAQCLWVLGDHNAAIDHYRALLELNPNDNQGNRYVLADWLLAEGRDKEFGALLQRYPDDAAAAWAYNRALWLFRKEGPGARAKKALCKAIASNPFVPPFLLGTKRLPSVPPALISLGHESEAVEYVASAAGNWLKTPYALDWLRDNAGEGMGSQPSSGPS